MKDLNWDTIGWPATQSPARRGPSFLHARDVGYRSAKNPIIAVITQETEAPNGPRAAWRPASHAATEKSGT